ncbi:MULTISPECIES: OmpA family protein [Falsihalocynthiibacter]|uniref:OmpA family protein n=1 Tax=Falsihalocynthiibacter TaxID=2854182 RepID=UPI0030022EBD
MRSNVLGLVLARVFLVILALAVGLSEPVNAQAGPFSGGWNLQPEASSLEFQSVKKQTVVESSSFATLAGTIDENGLAKMSVLLDSVDTKVDLRNVRMRFLFFETFKFPEATITTQINPADLTDLAQVRRKQIPLTYSIDLHGVSKTFETVATVTLLSDDLVSIASRTPISVAVEDFDLTDGLAKLQEAANVDIVPSATISFDFLFARATSQAAVEPISSEPAKPASVALEVVGNFDQKACEGRFEILSRTGSIYFSSGSARLQDTSAPLLNSLAEIIARCPDLKIEVGGHTDSDGGDAQNERLSRSRAASVVDYLLAKGLNPDMLESKGYGESNPIATNDTSEGKSKNRRIEFKVLGS